MQYEKKDSHMRCNLNVYSLHMIHSQVRKEAELMLTAAIESRSREDLSTAVALATQLRLRSPQVRGAPPRSRGRACLWRLPLTWSLFT